MTETFAGTLSSSAGTAEHQSARNVLKIDIVKVDSRDESQHDEFLVTFLDLGSSVRLVHDTPSHWHILGAGKPIEGNASHWLAFTRMLCEARNALKDSA